METCKGAFMITKTKKNIVTDKEVKREGWTSYKHQKEPHMKDVYAFLEKAAEYGNENKHRFMLCGKCLGVFVDYKPPVCSCGNFHGQKFREITGVMRKQLQAGHKIEKIMAHWII